VDRSHRTAPAEGEKPLIISAQRGLVSQIKFSRVPIGTIHCEGAADDWLGGRCAMLEEMDIRSNAGRLQCTVRTGQVAHAHESLLQGVFWGEPQGALVAHLGKRALVLQWPIDFGDAYTQAVLGDVVLGGVTLVAFFSNRQSQWWCEASPN